MDDEMIVQLYLKRDETAICETQSKYNNYLTKIAYNILSNLEDSSECVNDTYLRAWNSIPPNKPQILSTYLAKITRDLSIDIYRKKNCIKRKISQYAVSLSELEECVSDKELPENELNLKSLSTAINIYLNSLEKKKRDIFICRYYFFDSIHDICEYQNESESKIKSLLYRTRKGLKLYLKKEGFMI